MLAAGNKSVPLSAALAHGHLHHCYCHGKFGLKPDAVGKLARAAQQDAVVAGGPPVRQHRAELAVLESEGPAKVLGGFDGVQVPLCLFTLGVSQRAVAQGATFRGAGGHVQGRRGPRSRCVRLTASTTSYQTHPMRSSLRLRVTTIAVA